MKLHLRITKAGPALYSGIHDVADAEAFSKCRCNSEMEEQFRKESNAGVLMEDIENEASRLDRALIGVQPVQ
jgi:hypothetical protein